MIIIGTTLIMMLTCSVLVTTACMLSSQHGRMEEMGELTTFKMTDQLTDSPAAQPSNLGSTELPA